MKLVKLLVPVSLAINSFSALAIEDSNPFAEDYEQNRNVKTEPVGVSTYSFEKHPNRVTQLEPEKMYLQEALHTKSYGYAVVPKDRIQSYDELIAGYQIQEQKVKSRMQKAMSFDSKDAQLNQLKLEDVYRAYTFKKVAIQENLDGSSKLIIEVPGGNYLKGQGWDAVTRIFENSEFGNIIISEWHHSVSKGGVIMDEDAINFYVNGNPGILIIRESDSGKAETVLSWADEQKSYTVQFNKNANTVGLTQKLANFAESISQPFVPMHRLDQ